MRGWGPAGRGLRSGPNPSPLIAHVEFLRYVLKQTGVFNWKRCALLLGFMLANIKAMASRSISPPTLSRESCDLEG